MHALTTDYADTSRLQPNTLDVALDFLAAGLDPERCTIFVQSQVKQHFELPLLLAMITPLGWLERVPTYKEQQEKLREKDLTTYRVSRLSAAAVGGHSALPGRTLCPWGRTRQAHVELTREMARRFNHSIQELSWRTGDRC